MVIVYFYPFFFAEIQSKLLYQSYHQHRHLEVLIFGNDLTNIRPLSGNFASHNVQTTPASAKAHHFEKNANKEENMHDTTNTEVTNMVEANLFYILCNHHQANTYQNMINNRLFLLALQPNFIHSMSGYSINRIRVVLAEQNKTNRWLAEQMGKSEITISRWVQNKSQPSLEQLLQVAKLLSISPKDLINDINNN